MTVNVICDCKLAKSTSVVILRLLHATAERHLLVAIGRDGSGSSMLDDSHEVMVQSEAACNFKFTFQCNILFLFHNNAVTINCV